MRLDLNSRVRTRDGEDAGKIRYAIFDPDIRDVTHFVVSTGGILGRDVVVAADAMVPPEIAEDTSYSEPVVVVNLSKAELDRLPDFDPLRYTAPPAGWVSPDDYGYPPGGFLWPGSPAAEPAPPARSDETVDAVKHQDVRLGKGTKVFDYSGDEVGVVEDLRFDTANSDLLGVVVRLGGKLQTLFGGGETVDVPKDVIESVTPDGIHLRTSKEDLERIARAR